MRLTLSDFTVLHSLFWMYFLLVSQQSTLFFCLLSSFFKDNSLWNYSINSYQDVDTASWAPEHRHHRRDSSWRPLTATLSFVAPAPFLPSWGPKSVLHFYIVVISRIRFIIFSIVYSIMVVPIFFLLALLHPAHPSQPQSIPSPLSMSMSHLYMSLTGPFPLPSTILPLPSPLLRLSVRSMFLCL